MNKMLVLIRREYWENRSLWTTPLVIAALILVITAFGGVHVGDHGSFSFGMRTGPEDFSHLGNGAMTQRQFVYGVTMSVFTSLQLFVLGIVVFFYLLDSLLAERKDRSILFWKSLPISDAEVVGSKLLSALVVAPVFTLVVSAVMQLLFGFVWWARFHGTPLALALMPFDAGVWLQVQLGTAALALASIVWYLPIVGYLMLVSVWSRKNAFLWAVLPPVALLLVEGLILQSHNFGDFLGHRFVGVFKLMGMNDHERPDVNSFGAFLSHVGNVFTSYETWLGVFAAAVLIMVVIRFRRYRDDS